MMATSSAQCNRNDKIEATNQAASPISILPEELVVEILSRLSPKSFFRCRARCKSWFSISSYVLHLNKHLQPTLAGFFCNKNFYDDSCFVNITRGSDKVEVDGKMRALSSYDHFRILDSCNGLLLIEAFKFYAKTSDLYVYNPTTQTLIKVWSFKSFDAGILYGAFSLAFDPRVYPLFHIICFSNRLQKGEVSSLMNFLFFERSKCISHKELACDTTQINFGSRSTFVNGRVYRVTEKNEIMSIDPKKCSYQFIHTPDFERCTKVEVGQSKGRLHCMSLFDEKRLLSIWVFESHTQQEWTLKHVMRLHHIYLSRQPRLDLQNHYAFHPDKNILFLPVGDDRVMSLDLSTKNWQEHCIPLPRILPSWIYTTSYLI